MILEAIEAFRTTSYGEVSIACSSFLVSKISGVYACLVSTYILRHLFHEKKSKNLGFPINLHGGDGCRCTTFGYRNAA